MSPGPVRDPRVESSSSPNERGNCTESGSGDAGAKDRRDQPGALEEEGAVPAGTRTASRRDPPRGVGPGSPSAAPEDPHVFPQKREGHGGEHPNCGWPQRSGLEARLIKLCPSRESNEALAYTGLDGKRVPASGQRTDGLEDRFAAWIQAGRRFSSRPLPCVEADAGSQDSWRKESSLLRSSPMECRNCIYADSGHMLARGQAPSPAAENSQLN